MIMALITLMLSLGNSGEDSGYHWNFKGGDTTGLILTHASTTDNPEQVIEGKESLLVDARDSEEMWNEFIHTDTESVSLKPNTAYTISFRYRVLEPVGERVFYMLLRSLDDEESTKDIWGGWWASPDSTTRTKNFLLRTGDTDDYFVIIGIHGKGVAVIDELSIHHGPIPNDGLVAAKDFRFESQWQKRMASSERERVSSWLDIAQVVVDPGGWNYRVAEHIPQLIELNPDIGAYLPVDSQLVTELGFVRTRMSMEYQELYVVDAERAGVSWPDMVDRFTNDGLCIALDGEPVMDDTWAAGGYYTCHANEGWHQFYRDNLKAHYQKWEGLNQDNISVVGAFKGNLAYCEGCQSHFRAHLEERYSPDVLRSWGIDDVDSFDFLQFILKHSLQGRDALTSPVVREYIKCYYAVQLEAWFNVVDDMRSATSDSNIPYLVYGNQIGAMGPNPYGIVLSPWVDVVSMEHYWPASKYYRAPRFHTAGWGFKVAGAATGYRKPVYIMNALEADHAAEESRTICELTHAEGLANGGYRVFSPGANIPRYAGRQPIQIPEIRELHKQYADFIRANRGLFWGRESHHKAAVVYSIPTHMFHNFPPIPGMDDLSEYWRFAAACLMLEQNHMPYDVLVLPHPEVMPDTVWKEKLAGYDLLVLPGVAAVSSEQAQAVEGFLSNGGRVLAFSPFAERNENYNQVENLFSMQDHPQFRKAEALDLELGTDLWQRQANDEAASKIASLLDELYPMSMRQVVDDLSEDLVLNFWEDDNGKFYTVHIVNYGLCEDEDRSVALENMTLRIDLPERYAGYTPVFISPENASTVALKCNVDDGRAVVEIPRLNAYGIIVWGDSDYIRCKTDYAHAYNLAVRLAKLDELRLEELVDELTDLWKGGDCEGVADLRRQWQLRIDLVEEAVLDSISSGE